MSLLLRGRRAGVLVFLGLSAAAAIAAPAGCLFPEYTFNEPEPPTSTGNATGTNPENCTNGVDDDADGNADCADPKCNTYTCVPEIPAGWSGYFALYDGLPAGDPGCPADFPSTTTPAFLGNDGLTAMDATCACECEPPTWQGCAPLDSVVMETADTACGQASFCSGDLAIPAAWDGTCFGTNFYQGGQLTCGPDVVMTMSCAQNTGDPCNVSVRATGVAALNGSCQATPTVTKPDLVWERFGRACGDAPTTGGGCNVGQVCLPRMETPYESGVCIMMAGDNACPAGAFTEKHVFFDDVMDTRDCTACTCGVASGGSCPTTINIYSDTAPGCMNLIASFPAGECFDLVGNPTIAARAATAPGAPTGGSCLPSTPAATGTVMPTSPTTFCCIP